MATNKRLGMQAVLTSTATNASGKNSGTCTAHWPGDQDVPAREPRKGAERGGPSHPREANSTASVPCPRERGPCRKTHNMKTLAHNRAAPPDGATPGGLSPKRRLCSPTAQTEPGKRPSRPMADPQHGSCRDYSNNDGFPVLYFRTLFVCCLFPTPRNKQKRKYETSPT